MAEKERMENGKREGRRDEGKVMVEEGIKGT